MRKLSQDGGDSTSITSGIENEIKKSGPGILKSTKNSIKRKVQNFSHESDDTANEPLLLKRKEISEIEKQSARFLLSKTKTDFASEKGNDKDRLLADDKIAKHSVTDVTGITDAPISNGLKDKTKLTSQSKSTATIHNHMNTNVFNTSDGSKSTVLAKTEILVELDTSKPTGYSPSPLIFTTAKIHTDGKIQQMEPVQVTPVPILSTIEGGVVKTETKVMELDKISQQLTEKKEIAATPKTRVASICKLPEKHDVQVTSKESFTTNVSMNTLPFGNKGLISDNKTKVTLNGSEILSSKSTVTQISNIRTTMTEDSLRTKYDQPFKPNKENIADKLGTTPIKIPHLQQVAKSNDISKSVSKDLIKRTSDQATSAMNKNNVDINKNFQSQPKQGAATGSCGKEDKTTIDSVVNSKESKTGNSQESNIKTSKLKSPDNDRAVNTVISLSAGKPSSEVQSISKGNTMKSPESNVSYTDTSVPKTQTSSDTKSSVNTILAKEHAVNMINNTSIVKPIESFGTKGNTVKSSENNISKTDSSSLPTTVKFRIKDKGSSMPILKTTAKEPATRTKPSSVTMSSSTKSSVVSSVSEPPQITSSIKSVSNVNKAPLTNNIIKTMTSAPTTSLKSSVSLSSSSISPKITAENAGSIYKSNNVATVVSSISKPTTSAASSKLPSLSSSSTSAIKSPSTVKQSTTPPTVTTISPISTATVSTVPHDKISTKGAWTSLNNPVTSVYNPKPTSSTTKIASAAKDTPSAKVVASTSVKPAKASTQGEDKACEDIKDSKDAKA